MLCKFMDGEGTVQVIQYAPDGNTIAIGSKDSNIYIYQITEGGTRYSRIGKCSVSFTQFFSDDFIKKKNVLPLGTFH